MPKEVTEKLFNRFYQQKTLSPGAGVAQVLFIICRGIIENMAADLGGNKVQEGSSSVSVCQP